MIIDTTCSVIERKMKEVPKKSDKLDLNFRASAFTVNMDAITISTTEPIPVIFDGTVEFNGNVVFNKCVTFNGGVAGNIHWTNSVNGNVVFNKCVTSNGGVADTNSVPDSVSKAGSEHIDISFGIGTLDGLGNDDHPQYSWEWHSHNIKV